MSKTVPWSIKDVSLDAREAAVGAAREAGLSVGDWLDALIAERTGIDGHRRDIPQSLAATGTGDVRPASRVRDELRGGTALHGLSERLSAFEPGEADPRPASSVAGGRSSPLAARVAEAVAAIARRQADLDASAPMPAVASDAAVGALGRAVSSLEARLKASRDRESPTRVPYLEPPRLDAETNAAFATLSRDLRQAIAAIDSPAPARETALLSGKGRDDHAAVSSDDPLWSEIRALLDKFRPGAALDTLDQHVRTLTDRLDERLDTPASSTLIESLARRVEEMQASLKTSAPSPDMRGLEKLVRGMEGRLAEARSTSKEIQSLEHTVQRLAEQMEANRSPVDGKAIGTLEAQLTRLGERLERSEASLSSLDAVERTLSELFSQIEQTRHAAIDAAEAAARTAARDTLRAAMQHSAATRPRDFSPQPGALEKVEHEMLEFKAQHDAADRRTQETLSSLAGTMEKLLAYLETIDMGGRSAPAQKPEAVAIRDGDEGSRSPGAPAADPLDSLIEPRAGRPSSQPPEVSVDARRPGAAVPPAALAMSTADNKASFIAAARRAAQQAQASAAGATSMPPRSRARIAEPRQARFSAAATLERARTYIASRRRPLLLGLAGLVMLFGAVEVAKVTMDQPAGDASELGAAPAAAGPEALSPLGAPPAKGAATAALSSLPERAAQADRTAADAAAKLPPAAAPSRSQNPFLAGLTGALAGLPDGLRSAAEGGDAAADYEVGLRLAEGRTVNRDLKAAAAWFAKAAAQGLAPAQYRLGSAYEKGIGVGRDPEQAMSNYARAAEAGNIRAMHNLAVMAAEGAAGKPDYARAATWFSKAANFGVRDSQFNLAILYARGLGIEQDLGKSYLWFAVAAAQGDDDAAKKRDEVGGRLDAKALATAKAAAEAFRPVAPVAAVNDVAPPPGGWESLAPAAKAGGSAPPADKAAAGKSYVM